jgi:hypothetical protein
MALGHKLYILIRSDISPEQQAVQAGHAVAMFCRLYPKADWKNGKLIYLQVRDHDSIEFWQRVITKFSEVRPLMGVWRDPDYYNEQEVAMFVYGEEAEQILRDLPLMRFK